MRSAAALVLSAVSAAILTAPAANAQSLDLGDLQAVASTGLTRALFLTFAPGEPVDRLYILEQAGRVRVVNGTTLQTTSVLDISALVLAAGTNPEFGLQGDNEQGLLGIAFHPNFQTNRYFYVYYIEPRGSTFLSSGLTYDNGRSVIARYTMNPVVAGQNITADPASAQIVMRFDQPFTNHNGGCIRFGSDGFLYIGTGDGGSGGDPNINALNPNSYLGKMLRIDVNGDDFPADANRNYRIPAGNPTTWPTGTGGTQSGLPELWAIGLRNPWRWSFDRRTGDLWVGDVGQDLWEEIDFVPGNGGPGRNYGWRRWEGNNSYSTSISTYSVANVTFPVYVYPHTAQGNYTAALSGSSVTGGHVYRGSAIPGWRGRYFFADYVNSRIWSFRLINGVQSDFQDHTAMLTSTALGAPTNITSFGEDSAGELYTVHFSGTRIRKLVPSALSLSLSAADIAQGGGLPGPDGTVDGSDFVAFINSFAVGDVTLDPLADINNDGTIDGNDFVAFINAFAIG